MPQGRSGRAENLVPTGIRSWTIQPVVSRYSDLATRPTVREVPCSNIDYVPSINVPSINFGLCGKRHCEHTETLNNLRIWCDVITTSAVKRGPPFTDKKIIFVKVEIFWDMKFLSHDTGDSKAATVSIIQTTAASRKLTNKIPMVFWRVTFRCLSQIWANDINYFELLHPVHSRVIKLLSNYTSQL